MKRTGIARNRRAGLRRRVIAALTSGVLAGAMLASSASAAPSLEVGIEHRPAEAPGGLFSAAFFPAPPGPITRSDTLAYYLIKVKNTSSTTATCKKGSWSGTAPSFSYQWLRNGALIPGATEATYSPTAEDLGRSLQCQVTATNAGGASVHVNAPSFQGQFSLGPPSPAQASADWRPTVSGTTERTCAAPTNWNGGPTWTFQWLRNGVPIPGATTTKYTPKGGAGEEDQNKVLQCMVTAKNGTATAVAMSANTNVGSPPSPPANSEAPSTSGAEWTSGTTSVTVDLPEGVAFAHIRPSESPGWTCFKSSVSCTSTTSVAPGAEYSVIALGVSILAGVPDVAVATALASGGGSAGEAFGTDTLFLQPKLPFEVQAFKAGAFDEAATESFQAGSHPFAASARFEVPKNFVGFVAHDMHEIWTDLPVGFVGNPLSVPVVCPITVFEANQCPPASSAGAVQLQFSTPRETHELKDATTGAIVYRLKPEKGYPAEFGFKDTLGNAYFVFRVKVRTDSDYGITVIAPKTPQLAFDGGLSGAKFTFCAFGVKIRTNPSAGNETTGCRRKDEPGANAQPLMTIGTKCADGPPRTELVLDSWQDPGDNLPSGRPDRRDSRWKPGSIIHQDVTGCEILTEEWLDEKKPSLFLQPDTHQADTPAGYTARLHIPQDGLTDPDGLATSHLRNVSVSLGEGISLNPSVGDGIDVCTMEQMGALTGVGEVPPSFDTFLPKCPDGSKIGNARIDTPLLENPVRGSIYLAPQDDNPFGSDYAIYLVVEEPDTGIVVKLAGKVTPDQRTGQVHTTFVENPELPFEDLKLEFFGGGRAAIANPPVCGTFHTTNELTPWSAVDPFNPRPDEIARPTDPVTIDQGPNGSPCVDDVAKRPFEIGLSAGSRDPIAGAKSPFDIRITRPDGNQEITKLEISPPPGFVASLKGVPYCSEAQIAAAASNSGKAEQRSPSCPLASDIGRTNSAAGAGGTPFYAPGKIYLAGPYKGETLSVVAITPAVAGPFDLGNVVIRSALHLDSRTARITAITDEIPQIVNGIPLRVRDIRINLDRPGWAQNPTNCEAMSVDVTAFGANGAIAKPSNRYQVGQCEKLPFKPKLQIKLIGGTKRGDHPSLLAVLKARPGDANIARAAVTLPPSAFLDQAHIRTICTRVQFAARTCPTGAIYGSAWATTPLLDDPIQGDVVLRSSDNKLPDLIGNLRGVANIELVGRIDSVRGGLRSTFDVIPDATVDTFRLRMQGGDKGLVINSKDLCSTKNRATVKFTGQNGRQHNTRPLVVAPNCKKAKKKAKKAKKTGSAANSR